MADNKPAFSTAENNADAFDFIYLPVKQRSHAPINGLLVVTHVPWAERKEADLLTH